MKLTQAQAQRVEDQIDAEAVPDTHPAASQLEDVFGGHTFFLGPRGLHVVEPGTTESGKSAAALVKIASWGDEQQTKLLPEGARIDGEVELDPDEDADPAV
jgi:hypothetical protein